MQLNIKSITLDIIRLILFLVGALSLVLSFFHGLDINIGTVVGLTMIVASLGPYVPSDKKIMAGMVIDTLVCLISYVYFLKLLMINQNVDYELGNIGLLTLVFYLLPLISLIYLFIHFVKLIRSN